MKLFKDKKNIKIRIIAFICLFALAVIFLAPYFWMLSNSFKTTKEIILEPTNLLPHKLTLDGYRTVFEKSPFFSWMRNSLVVTITDTLVVLLTSSIVGFVLSKYRFKLNKFFFYVILATMMVPGTTLMVPGFLVISKLGWYDKLTALIVPSFLSAYGVFMCKQFIDDIPKELFESALLDHASDFKIYYKIVLPSIRPALGSLTIFTFLGIWNDYTTPLLYLNSTKKMTISLAVSFFSSQHSADLSATMAAAALIMIPTAIVFIIFQKQFIKGISMTGMK